MKKRYSLFKEKVRMNLPEKIKKSLILSNEIMGDFPSYHLNLLNVPDFLLMSKYYF